MKVELEDVGGGNVISLEVRRRAAFKGEGCNHLSIIVNEGLTTVECKTCGEKNVSPIDWIRSMIGEWFRVKDLMVRYKTALARYEAKQRTRCEHCSKITRVNPATAAEVRKFERDARQDAGKHL